MGISFWGSNRCVVRWDWISPYSMQHCLCKLIMDSMRLNRYYYYVHLKISLETITFTFAERLQMENLSTTTHNRINENCWWVRNHWWRKFYLCSSGSVSQVVVTRHLLLFIHLFFVFTIKYLRKKQHIKKKYLSTFVPNNKEKLGHFIWICWISRDRNVFSTQLRFGLASCANMSLMFIVR